MIQLSAENALAQGGEKIVFNHPSSEDLLVKVINPRYARYMDDNWPISTRLRRLPHYWFYINELIEHVFSREAEIPNNHFIQNIVGLTDTNLGLGMIVEAVRNNDGELACSLAEIIDKKEYSQIHHDATLEMIDWINDNYIIVRDLTAANIVWNEKENHFVLIDGIGARRLPSLRSVSKRYNQHSNIKRTEKLKKRLNNQLSKNGFSFSF